MLKVIRRKKERGRKMKIYILIDYSEPNLDDRIHSVYDNEVDAKLKLADFVLEDPRADFDGLRIIEKELERNIWIDTDT